MDDDIRRIILTEDIDDIQWAINWNDGFTHHAMLVFAAANGKINVVKCLLETHHIYDYFREAAAVANHAKHLDVVELLCLYASEDLDIATTAAMNAIIAKDYDKLEELISDYEAIVVNNRNALLTAIDNGDNKIVKMLMDCGVEANNKEAFHVAIKTGNLDIVNSILSHGDFTEILSVKEIKLAHTHRYHDIVERFLDILDTSCRIDFEKW